MPIAPAFNGMLPVLFGIPRIAPFANELNQFLQTYSTRRTPENEHPPSVFERPGFILPLKIIEILVFRILARLLFLLLENIISFVATKPQPTKSLSYEEVSTG